MLTWLNVVDIQLYKCVAYMFSNTIFDLAAKDGRPRLASRPRAAENCRCEDHKFILVHIWDWARKAR